MYNNSLVTARHTTPPSYNQPQYFPDSAETHYTNFYSSNGNSPDSIVTNNTTPPHTPRTTIRSNGPPLLPKIRCQDHTTEPSSTAGPVNHGRAVSLSAPLLHTTFPYPRGFHRRGTSPLGEVDNSPASACSLPASVFSSSMSMASCLTSATTPSSAIAQFPPSPCNSLHSPIAIHSSQASRRSSLAHVRTASNPITSYHGHSKSDSTSSIDEAAILKHGYPTQYRQIPQYITAAPNMASAPAMATPSIAIQHSNQPELFLPEDTVLMAADLQFSSFAQEPTKTTSLLSYLTTPNPRPRLVTRSITDSQRHMDFGWWDVRNLRSWTDFTLDNIFAISQFPHLLQVPLDFSSLPHPQPMNPTPETEYALRDVFRDFFATKVNAALETTQGPHHLSMRAVNSATTQHYPKPDFISAYPNDFLKTLRGDPRGHLVGIVKAYEEWNSAMRSESAPQQVKYLRGLAQIHRIMREHGCRYGFIITEIEILCVRAGADDPEYMNTLRCNGNGVIGDGPKPIFGFLETAAPIELSTTGLDPHTGAPRMTAGLALWFLHMLAKDEPLRGYLPWKMDVGGPAAVTRQNHLPRDGWMPKVALHESRIAKRLRGWVWPEEPFSRKEAPNQRRRGGANA